MSADAPIFARVYAATVQRLQCDFRQLNSSAVFLLACAPIRKIYVWVGSRATADDVVLAETVAFDVLREDFLNVGELETIREGHEPPASIDAMLGQLFMSVADYRQHATFRAGRVADNCALTLSVVERKGGTGDFALRTVEYAVPNRAGTVPTVPFVPSVDRNTIVVLTTGSQYDVWLAEAVPRRDKAAIKAFIVETALAKIPPKQRGIEAVNFDRNLCFVGQDRPTAVFRANFTPTTRHLATSNANARPRAPSFASSRKAVNPTKGSNQKCSDCVGDTILRLLGISSKPSPWMASSPSSSTSTASDDDSRSTSSQGSTLFCTTEALQSAFSGRASSSSFPSSSSSSASDLPRTYSSSDLSASSKDSVYVKIQRLISKTEVQYISPPRRNMKLLVLDLDHTLMDFSCRFDYMAEQLKRPYLDQFLAKAHVYYDIVVWSQTNFKWLELKLTELGMLNRKDYKICFALDKSTMLTVKQNYVKPLEIIWAKCASFGWGPHNTIHVDDLERNFELNKQCGVLISPFHLKPSMAGNPVDCDGNSMLDGTAFSSFLPPPPPLATSSSKQQLARNPSFGGGEGGTTLTRSGSASKLVPISKGFEDVELQLLARYLVYIAVTVSDFSAIDHSLWRTRALEMPKDR